MKNTFILFGIIALLASCGASQSLSGQKRPTEKLTVYGSCGMCKEKIEETLTYTEGVIFSEWDIQSKELEVKYNSEKISLDEIKQILADIGYDSDSHRATDEVYNKLHACCKYERPAPLND